MIAARREHTARQNLSQNPWSTRYQRVLHVALL